MGQGGGADAHGAYALAAALREALADGGDGSCCPGDRIYYATVKHKPFADDAFDDVHNARDGHRGDNDDAADKDGNGRTDDDDDNTRDGDGYVDRRNDGEGGNAGDYDDGDPYLPRSP